MRLSLVDRLSKFNVMQRWALIVCDCVSLLVCRIRICVSCIYAVKCWWLHVTSITNLKPGRFHLHTNNIRVQFIKKPSRNLVALQLRLITNLLRAVVFVATFITLFLFFWLFWRIWPSVPAQQHFEVFLLLLPSGFIAKSPNKLQFESPLFKLP